MTACPYLNRPCRIAKANNPKGLNQFQRCLLCLVAEHIYEQRGRRER